MYKYECIVCFCTNNEKQCLNIIHIYLLHIIISGLPHTRTIYLNLLFIPFSISVLLDLHLVHTYTHSFPYMGARTCTWRERIRRCYLNCVHEKNASRRTGLSALLFLIYAYYGNNDWRAYIITSRNSGLTSTNREKKDQIYSNVLQKS